MAVEAVNALTRRWLASHVDGSTVVSGPGIWVLLAALLGGASGPAREELAAAVGVEPSEALALWSSLDASPAVRGAAAVWTQESVPLLDAWVSGLPPATVGRLVDQATVDEWVTEATGGEITALPIKIEPEILMVLASVLTVRTQWTSRFDTFADDVLRDVVRDLDRLRVVDGVTLLTVPGEDDVDVVLMRGAVDASPAAVLSAGLGGLHVASSDLDGPGITVTEIDSSSPGDSLWIRTVAFEVSAAA